MITFITKRTDHKVWNHQIQISDNLDECIAYISKLKEVGIDTETNNLVPVNADLLLISLGDKENQFVIDCTSVASSGLAKLEELGILWLGHNIKYDRAVLACNGFTINNLYCTMIAEQTIGMGAKRRNSLDAVIERRLGIKHAIGKDVRKDFIRMKPWSIFKTEHILYSAEDIVHLFDIKEKQLEIANLPDRNQTPYLLGVEMPLIEYIDDCEREGLFLNTEKWLDTLAKKKKEKYRIERELDVEIKDLLRKLGKDSQITGKVARNRNVVEAVQTSMFGVMEKTIVPKHRGNINYSSSAQVKDLFILCSESAPKAKDKKTGEMKASVGGDALEQWLIENYNSPMRKVVKLLTQHADVRTKISSFGLNYIEAINPKTGKLHTTYRTCDAETGRFTSGDMKKTKRFNSQQVPKEKEYRECFYTDEGYDIQTCDLSGAELIILASMSGEKKLIELALGDIHSYLATAAFRKLIVYTYKINMGKGKDVACQAVKELLDGKHDDEKVDIDLIHGFFSNPKSFEVSKKNFKWIRDAFKSVVYGLAYGAAADRIAKVLDISKVAGQLVADTIAEELPVTMATLEANSKFGVENGYIQFNARSNSRRWFENVVNAAKYHYELSFKEKGEIERACKNSPIQGTQANMIKEAIVNIGKYCREHKLDVTLLLCVHDEVVYKFPTFLNEEVLPYKDKLYSFPELVKTIMCDVCNRYLRGVEMGAEYHVGKTWTK